MRPVSDRFLKTITGSHTAIFRARVILPDNAGQTGTNPIGTEVSIIGGDVQLDAGADIRSTIELDIAAPWPTSSYDLLAPYGTEIFAERGVAYGGGATEWVSLGYFRLNIIEQDDAPDGPIRLSGTDRMSKIVDATLTDVKQYAATATYGAVLSDLVLDADASVAIEWDEPAVRDSPIGRTFIVEEDRYGKAKELVTGLGKVFYFDYRGILVVRTPLSVTDPVWIVSRGEGGVLVKASRSLSREGVHNGVLAIGEALDTKPPARGLATDDGPSSPTRWGGPFGKVPATYASPLLTTDAQARLAAATVLRRSLGLPYNVDLDAVPNPALEPDDPIAIGIEGKPYVLPRVMLAADSFTRTVTNGWATSERGDGWSASNSDYQVIGDTATVGLSAANTITQQLNSTARGRTDADAYVDVRVLPAVGAVAGGALIASISLRAVDTNTQFSNRLEFNTNGTVTAKIGRHSARPGAGYRDAAALVGFDTFAVGEWWTIRARARGAIISMKAWKRGTTEPREWLLSVSDTPRLVDGVRFGLYMWRLSGNTNAGPQWEVDNWRVFDAPDDELQGGEIHVIDSMTIPLTADGAMSATTREQTLVTVQASS